MNKITAIFAPTCLPFTTLLTTLLGISVLSSFTLLSLLPPMAPPTPKNPTPPTYPALPPPPFSHNDFDGSHSCSTTIPSAFSIDITSAATSLNNLPRSTRCTHTASADCTVLSTVDSASIAICGVGGLSVYCYQAAWAAEAIDRDCGWNGLGQGSVIFNQVPDVSIVVAHYGYFGGGKDFVGLSGL